MTSADVFERASSVPRYELPDQLFESEPNLDEVVTCNDCTHCFRINESCCRAVLHEADLTGIGKHIQRRVRKEFMRAIRCFGMCEVRGDMVYLGDVPCDHFEE